MKTLTRVLCLVLAMACLLPCFSSVLAEEATQQRIVCLAPDMVEIVYALGLGDQIVGWSAYTDYPVEVESRDGWKSYLYYYNTDTADFNVEEELSHEVATVSKFYDYNAAILEGLNPTIILGSEYAQQGMVDELKGKGYNAYCFTPASLEDVYNNMIEIGKLLGVEDYARELVAGYKDEIEEIKAITSTLEPVPVYFEIAHRTDYGEYGAFGPYTMAAGTPFEDMLEIAGGKNIFGDMTGDYIEVTFEDIVTRNPAVIMSPYWPDAQEFEVTTLYEIMTRPDFCNTDAVKTGRVMYYDSSLMKRFGPRSITAIKKLAYLLHPYYFSNPENSVSPWELGQIDKFEKPVTSLR